MITKNHLILLLFSLLFFPTINVLGQSFNEKVTNSKKTWMLGPFRRPSGVNPIISPLKSQFFCPMNQKMIKWEEGATFNPAAVLKDGKIVVLYRAEDNTVIGIGKRTSRIGYAESENGVNVSRQGTPVLYPKKDKFTSLDWHGGCEDPRVVVTQSGLYVMLYTGWNRDNPKGESNTPRLCVATSRDLKHWTKHGLAFGKANGGKFKYLECKSASIVTKVQNGKIIVAKVNGHYFMYWGEKAVCAAYSDDLIHWTPLLDKQGNLLKLVTPRKGCFDSQLTECGPPALMTRDGIILIYNGKNSSAGDGDPNYPRGTYAAGQILFDKDNPCKMIDRLDYPFFWPEEDFEKSGQYPDGTVFTEGLVYQKGSLFLYYGCADSFVAVATCKNDLRVKLNDK
ncbi:MAG: glycoside hydrolase family 130 protein [Prevotella sp.]|jgi:predicted GH43/DUF377 family glycosyl hydrolase|nr:glycoside hydrolase family 130 protein [Prevotella sp.]MCH3994909.1 glycoside hydrolase family 130 protein [Prevotella sp.]MCI1246998.1 glycoside hydrolase family 130 protein [Prevotella sp.]